MTVEHICGIIIAGAYRERSVFLRVELTTSTMPPELTIRGGIIVNVDQETSTIITSSVKERGQQQKKNVSVSKKEKQDRLEAIIHALPTQKLKSSTLHDILTLLMPILRFALDEDVFRFLLGCLSFYTSLTNKQIAQCAKCSPKRVQKGRIEVSQRICPCVHRKRKRGGGRKRITSKNPRIITEIMKYIELRSYGPCTKGTQEYTAATANGIREMVYRKTGTIMSENAIRKILKEKQIRLRTNKKLLYGNEKTETEAQRVIRHLQFDYIYKIRGKVHDPNCVILSVDCKKKEILGPFARINGRSLTFPGRPVKANEHDFMIPLKVATLVDEDDLLDRQEGKAIPYGIYDLETNKGYVSVGISHDTPEFVATSISRFIVPILEDHPHARKLYLLCDGGGSNSSNSDAFKFQIALISRKIGMPIEVVHYPPYRSKFNPIERQLFAWISKRFERTILYNLRTVITEIRNTTTKKGLHVFAELDTGIYELKQKPTPEQMKLFQLQYTGTEAAHKLSYEIDGTGISDADVPKAKRVTVFDIKHNIDLTREQKQAMKEVQAARKAERLKAREAKTAEKKNGAKQKRCYRRRNSLYATSITSLVPT